MANSLYLCMYVSMYVCSDTSSTCLSRMCKCDGKDRHDADASTCIKVQYQYRTVATSVEYQYMYD